MIRICAIVTVALAVSWVGGAAAHRSAGCTDSWTASGGGSWSTATNWSTGHLPTNTDAVCITAPGTYTVTVTPYPDPPEPGDAEGPVVSSLTLGGSGGSQTLEIAGQSSVSNSNETNNTTVLQILNDGTIGASGTLILDATGGGTPTPGQAVGGSAVLIDSKALTNSGRIETKVDDKSWRDYFSGTVVNEPSASITVSSGELMMPSPSTSGYGSAYAFAVTNNGSMTIGTGASLYLEGGIGAAGAFLNTGTIKNGGSITGAAEGGPVAWTQKAGSVQGKPVELRNGASLADSAGAAQFVFDDASGALTGTIPAGQTITVRGEAYSYQGEEYYGTAVTLNTPKNNAPPVVNHGTVLLDSPGKAQTSGGPASLVGGALVNDGKLVATVEDPSWMNKLQVALVNGRSGTVEVKTGVLQQNAVVPTTNHGLATVDAGAQWALNEGGTFVNERDGTIAVQVAGKTKVGTFLLTAPCCAAAGKVTAGGTLAPTLVHGYKPPAKTSLPLFQLGGGQFSGTFAKITGGFAGDYSHETASPAYAGVVYGAKASGKKKK